MDSAEELVARTLEAWDECDVILEDLVLTLDTVTFRGTFKINGVPCHVRLACTVCPYRGHYKYSHATIVRHDGKPTTRDDYVYVLREVMPMVQPISIGNPITTL